MGQLVLPPGGSVYVDTNAVIYAVEQIEPFHSAGRPLWDAVHAGSQVVVTSELTLLEVLVKPLRDGNASLAALYRQVLLGTLGLSPLPVARPILESAAQIRASTGLRTPDAIHAATALAAGCLLLVTNDPVFRKVPGLNVCVLSEVAAAP